MAFEARQAADATRTPDRAAPEAHAEVAPEAADAPGARGTAGSGGLPPPTLRPAALLALQRSMGNRAVQRLLAGRLQRQPPAAAPPAAAPAATTGLDASMLEVQGGDLQKGGNVTAKPSGDKVTINAPAVSYSATVSLKSGVTLGTGDGGRIDVGPVQTVLGGDRTGVYRKGGDPKGDVTSEERQTVSQSRDAQFRDKPGGGKEATVPAPWYSQPSNVSDSTPSTQISFHDRPGFDFPKQSGDGRLTETRGQDRFVVSVGAKRGGQLIHLKPQHWEVPWNVTLDNQATGTGGTLTGGLAREGPPTTDGPIAVNAARSWTSFTSIEAAMAASPAVLLENLLPAKANDPSAYQHICEALRRKNPSFTVKVEVVKTASIFGADEIVVSALGTKQAGRGGLKLNDGQAGQVSIAFNDVFDVAAINGNTQLIIAVQDFGEMFAIFQSDPAVLKVSYPYAPASTEKAQKAGGGSLYKLSLTW